MTYTTLYSDLINSAQRLERSGKLLHTVKSDKDLYHKRDVYLAEAPILGLSTESLDYGKDAMLDGMSRESLRDIAKSGADVLKHATSLYDKFGSEIKSAGKGLWSIYSFIGDLKKEARLAATSVNAKAASEGISAARGEIAQGTHDLLKQGARGLASSRQIKMILIAMTATMAFVGFALSSLVSAIHKQEGIPTLSEKLSAKLRSIRWPFGDIGLSKESGDSFGSLTVGGKEPTTLEKDAASDLSMHMSPEMNLSDLPDGAPTDPFSDSQVDQAKGGLLQAIKAHPIIAATSAIAMVVGVFVLCHKLLTYVVRDGAALVKRSLAPYAASLKVRPLK